MRLPKALSVSYLVLGFLGAISLSFPLLFAHVSWFASDSSRPRAPSSELQCATFTVVLCQLLATGAIVALPYTVHGEELRSAYIVALLLLHGVLALPSIAGRCITGGKGTTGSKGGVVDVTTLYWLLSGVAATVHFHNWIHVLGRHHLDGFAAVAELFAAGWSNSCQTSISFDVVFTHFATALFMVEQGGARGVALAALSLVGSAAVVFPVFLALREARYEQELRKKQ
jgi:hypothetical protein